MSEEGSAANSVGAVRPRALLATTAMLSFIPVEQGASLVLISVVAPAFYASGLVESAIGKSAPWFVLMVMVTSCVMYAVYIESCSMFVRNGYREVKEAIGAQPAKFSVSVEIFGYLLAGSISGVVAGHYAMASLMLVLDAFHVHVTVPIDTASAGFAAFLIVYLWWRNTR